MPDIPYSSYIKILSDDELIELKEQLHKQFANATFSKDIQTKKLVANKINLIIKELKIRELKRQSTNDFSR